MTKKLLLLFIPLAIAIVSVFGLSKVATNPDTYSSTIASLDERKTTVLELTAAATTASVAISAIPGDTATPIAEKLTDLTSFFLLALCAIYLEKYLITVIGYATFLFLIPVGCLCFVIGECAKKSQWKSIAYKLAGLGIALSLVVPVSVQISNIIDSTYSTSIQETIDQANALEESEEEDEDGNVISNLWDTVTDTVGSAVDKVENILNNFIEALAVMLVTCCVIPLLVLAFFLWMIKTFLSVDINVVAIQKKLTMKN